MEKKMTKGNKKPWLAALLNFFIPGLGYLYLGKRKNFGILLIIAEILFILLTSGVEWSIEGILALPSAIVYSIAFAYDGYKTAKEM